jgi:4-deoxy-L-threo-5-hexosulose-uronate ketol-isomerase
VKKEVKKDTSIFQGSPYVTREKIRGWLKKDEAWKITKLSAKERLKLEPIDPLKAGYFLERRELGIINVGGQGIVEVDGQSVTMGYKEALYVGRGKKEIWFSNTGQDRQAHFYFNSAPAHREYPVKRVGMADAEVSDLGAPESSNARRINKLIINGIVDSCQLQMGLTELKAGSVWNTMPPHVHSRRMEAYFYFEVPENQAVCHFMGTIDETRHIWLGNEEAVISPPWSIHSATGTSNYAFIWGMAGENLDYTDMDGTTPSHLK